MDAEAKRQKKNEYQRNWRAKNKETAEGVISKPELSIDLQDIEPLKYKPKKAKAVPLKDSTVNTYVSKLRAFHKRMTGLPLSQNTIDAIEGNEYDKKAIKDEFKYLYDRIEYIKENELNAIPNLCKIFTKFVGFVKLIKILTPIKWKIENALEVRRNETTIKEEDLISFDKQDLLQNANKLTDTYDKIMYLLMTLLPTRRLSDYRNMTYGESEGNYYDDDNMYIRDIATKNKKSIVIKIPNEIIDILPHTGFILGNEYSQPLLSRKFAMLMEQIYGKKFGASDLRRMYLTYINKQTPSYLERKDLADQLGHSVEEGMKYSMKVQAQAQAQEQDEGRP